MKRTIAISLLLFLVSYLAYREHLQIATRIWHWRHGNILILDNYVVPVPRNWYVRAVAMPNGKPESVNPFDTNSKIEHDNFAALDTISVTVERKTPSDLEFWGSFHRLWLERAGVSPIYEQRLNAADESIVCLGGNELRQVMHAPFDAISLHCLSTGASMLSSSVNLPR